MKKPTIPFIDRRNFLKWSGCVTTAAATFPMFPGEFAEAKELLKLGTTGRRALQAACPYCGVGCGTLISTEGDRIVGIIPDKLHPTNKGVQCIKGLNAHEPVYRDRLTHVLVRKDMSDPDTGHVSATKGRFDDDVFVKMPYEEAEELVAEKMASLAKKYGGNSIGLSGSGQLTMEAQWVENILLKGVLASNSIEANARMCMTSAVTGYFASYGSDAPPTSYEDLDDADMITFWGHNAREAHPVLFWRVADHKNANDIPTVVADPRRTGTVQGLESINPRNSFHIPTLNGDISYLNAIAHVIITKYPEAVMPEAWLEENANGWREYVQGIKERYSPQQVVERLKLVDRGRVTVETIEQVAKHWAEASIKGRKAGKGGVLTYWGIGYNQMLHGQHNTISIINLHLLTGNLGRPGCGTHSQTGQPNAMSERLMGGLTGPTALQPTAQQRRLARSHRGRLGNSARAFGADFDAEEPDGDRHDGAGARGRPQGDVLDVHDAHSLAGRRDPGAAGADEDVLRRPGDLPPRTQSVLRRRRVPGDHLGRMDGRHIHPVGAPRLRLRRCFGGARREGQRPRRRRCPTWTWRSTNASRSHASSASMQTRWSPTRRRSRTSTVRHSTIRKMSSKTSSRRQRVRMRTCLGCSRCASAMVSGCTTSCANCAVSSGRRRRTMFAKAGGTVAALHAPGGLEESAVRELPPPGRQGAIQALRAGLRCRQSDPQRGHRRVQEVRGQ